MSFLPDVKLDELEIVKGAKSEYKDFLLDKNTMKFTAIGKQNESLRNWCECAIRIPRYKYSVCPYEYGCEILTLRDEQISEEEIKDLAEYYIIESLKINEYIDDVKVTDFKIIDKKISCRVIVKTIYDEEIILDENYI